VLTHLLGQSLEELTHKLQAYRQAWRDAGHPGEGKVTLMLHTFVGETTTQVRAAVKEPMKGYLRSSLDLVKQARGRSRPSRTASTSRARWTRC
jgi:alkanesulfonate monooxygenase SsuD/methylene tetrahydromethanopterin reductase-like flavin-dependent oxidoreductase (luciferase family)